MKAAPAKKSRRKAVETDHMSEADFAAFATAQEIAERERAKNVPPANVWQTLRRLYNCNRQQLAARLGVSVRTLRNWENAEAIGESAGKGAHERAALLMQAVLRAAQCDQHAQWRINWDSIATIGGKR